ncbi:MAG: NAD(P)/FAD-dependent oxidoreductase [Gemmatimonadales bacterium]|nr:NAD(P)/FAD-dependent oxidoreductase [Gemmatimonadales bacterium]
MSRAYDAVVIGAGVGELVAANYLARAGQRVLVLEDHDVLGGVHVTEEAFPGFRVDTCASDIGFLNPQIIQDLDLSTHGLEVLSVESGVFAPVGNGDGLLLRDGADTMASIARLSPADASRWMPFSERIARLAGFLWSLYCEAPPLPTSKDRKDLFALLGIGRRLRGLGKVDMLEFLRTVPMPVADLLDDWFESDVLKGCLGAAGVSHLFQGPKSAGTAFVMLHHHVGQPGALRSRTVVRGGVGSLASALARAFGASGGELRSETGVDRILVRAGRVSAVVMQGGEEIPASRVVCGADPKRTFLELVDPTHLDPEFLQRVQHIKLQGVAAKVNLALSELPDFGCSETNLRGTISIAPSLDYLERAYDASKYGRISDQPYLEAVIPSLVDPSLAPSGKHVMSVWMQYAPYRLQEGEWGPETREALGDRVIDTLAQYAPNLPAAIMDRQVLSPRDIESRFGFTEGHFYQGDLTLDQVLFMRPVPGWSRYATPIEGLYLAGPGTHPGGGPTGMSGYLAARQMLKQRRRQPRSTV